MVRCPSCGSYRVFVIVSPERRARCIQCGAKWVRVPATVSDEPPVPSRTDHPSVTPPVARDGAGQVGTSPPPSPEPVTTSPDMQHVG